MISYQVAPLPPNETERLKTLRSYALLDTPREESFDRIANLVARLLNVPMAAISLVDETRQWFKAACGFAERETPREVAFCAHTILQDEMMIVPDATQDPRFAGNPLVTDGPKVRFYAGIPLKGHDGSNIGTLCAVDQKPRTFTEEQKELLKDLAGLVASEFRLRLETLEKSQLATAIMNVNSVVLVTDPKQPGNPIVFCNPALSKVTGYNPKEVIGRTFGILRGKKSDPKLYEDLHRAIAERKPYRGTLLNYRKNGEAFWNDVHINPVFDEHGQLVNFVGLGHDVTEHKQTADTLRENYEKLKELEQLRDNLTHMIIHDLRAPLAITMGFLEYIEQSARARLNTGELSALKGAIHGAGQINEMVSSLLDISRLESGKMPMEIETYNLVDLTMRTLAQEVALVGAQRLQLDFPEKPVRVRCDAKVLPRVINNLVGNALKFSAPDTPVKVQIVSEAGVAFFTVSDEGPGIPKNAQTRIFEKFGQIKGPRYVHSSGLGLTFCKLAVEAQCGRIGVESEPGEGSTFWFSLPLAES